MEKKIKWSEDILNNHPKVAASMHSWVKSEMIKLQTSMVANLPKGTDVHLPEISESDIQAFAKISLAANPRSLYDFFDSKEIYICIGKVFDDFTYTIGVGDTTVGGKSRTWTEDKAFEAAFELLESKL